VDNVARTWLIVVAAVAVAAAVLATVALALRNGDDGVIPDRIQPGAQAPPAAPAQPAAPSAQCPAGVPGCRAVSGRIIYVEAVDPDGDGDAHFVLTGRNGVTGPGISVIDVEKGMRPRPLPRPGDLVTAAGPVYRGSYGQRQIQATELHVARSKRR
jgi:hypothetical protein